MNWIVKILWMIIRNRAKARLMLSMRRQGVIAYLRTLQLTRKLIALALLSFFFLQSIVLAGVGALVTGVWLLDLDPQAKLMTLFCVFTALFLFPIAGLIWLLSESLWYRVSGAKKLVEDLQSK